MIENKLVAAVFLLVQPLEIPLRLKTSVRESEMEL